MIINCIPKYKFYKSICMTQPLLEPDGAGDNYSGYSENEHILELWIMLISNLQGRWISWVQLYESDFRFWLIRKI